jgi:hypothetical protein
MFHLVSDVRSRNIVVKSFRIVFDDDFTLTLALIFPFYELFVQSIIAERFHKGTEFLLLVVPSRTSRIYKNWRTDDRC